MSKQDIYLIFAFLMLSFVFIVPRMLRLRIKALNWLHWKALADWHERNYKTLVPTAQVILILIFFLLLYLGLYR